MQSGFIDETGNTHHNLFVLYKVVKNGRVYWHCKCKCGNETDVRGDSLRNGHTQSCGCLQREQVASLNMTHGCAYEPWYTVYAGMMRRCGHWEGASERKLRLYRDRGITVCEEWRESPLAFGNWLLAHGWRKGLQIDRIDNSQGYCPENCRVVTRRDNLNNKRNTVRLDDGTPLAMFCSSIGIETCEGGAPTKKYDRIQRMWWRAHKIHPELMQALKDDTDRQSRLLEMTKLKIRHAELMIEGIKKLTTSKSDTP